MQFRIFVISMRTSLERREQCAKHLAARGVSFEFFDAVDGRLLDDSAIQAEYSAARNVEHFKRPLVRAEIGCYLSHKVLWKIVASSDQRASIILEDDCILSEGFGHAVGELEKLDLSRVIVKLDGSAGTQKLPDPNAAGASALGLIRPRIVPPYTTGYVIGRAAAGSMLATRKVFFRPVDVDLKFVWEHQVPVLLTNSPVIGRNLLARSSIEGDRIRAKPNIVRRLVRNVQYQCRFQFANYRFWKNVEPTRAFNEKIILSR